MVTNVMEADAADSGPFANPLDQPAPLGVCFAGLGVREDPFGVSFLFPQAPERVVEFRPHVKQIELHGAIFPLSGPETDGFGSGSETINGQGLMKALVPKIIGLTAAVQEKKSSGSREARQWDESSFSLDL